MDIRKWCEQFADLFSRTFKPLLDVILSTHKLYQVLGYQGPALLYSYFVCNGFMVGLQTPPFGKMVATLSTIEAKFTQAHSRLVAHSEEIAFLGFFTF